MKTEFIAIHMNVLIVLIYRADGWCAYCTPVPGHNHREEVYLWERDGEKLSERHARAFFPHVDSKLPYAR